MKHDPLKRHKECDGTRPQREKGDQDQERDEIHELLPSTSEKNS